MDRHRQGDPGGSQGELGAELSGIESRTSMRSRLASATACLAIAACLLIPTITSIRPLEMLSF